MKATKNMYRSVFLVLILFSNGLSAENKKDSLMETIDDSLYYYHQSAWDNLNFLTKEFKLTEEEYNRSLYYKGILNHFKGNQDTALYYLDIATNYYSITQNNKMYGKCFLGLAWIADVVGNEDLATKNYFKAIEQFKDSTNIDLGLAYINLAHHLQVKNQSYEEYFRKGYSILKTYGNLLNKLFAEYKKCELKNTANSIEELKQLAFQYNKAGFKNKSANMFRTISSKFYNRGILDSALFYANKANVRYEDEFFGQNIFLKSLQLKGQIFYKKNIIDSALFYFYKVKGLYSNSLEPNKQFYPYWYISRIDTINGDFEKAFKDFNTAIDFKNRLVDEKHRREAKLEEISSRIAKLNYDVLKYKEEKKIVYVYLISSVCILITIFSIFLLRLSIKQRRLLIRNQELERLKDKINTELVNLQKQKHNATLFAESTNLVGSYELVYKDSLNKIQIQFPQLSNSQAMYALMFAQNLSNNVICELQNIQASSIRMTKLRLRKVLNLEKDCDLYLYFKQFI